MIIVWEFLSRVQAVSRTGIAKGHTFRLAMYDLPVTLGDNISDKGDNTVDKPGFADGRVWIDTSQHFGDGPEGDWHFYIGGDLPEQTWLKDRIGSALSHDDIKHYQGIQKILSETDRIMATITLPMDAPTG